MSRITSSLTPRIVTALLLVIGLVACGGGTGGNGGGSISGTVSMPATGGASAQPTAPPAKVPSVEIGVAPGPRYGFDLASAPKFVPGEVIVKFRPSIGLQSVSTLSINGVTLNSVRPLALSSTALYRSAGLNERETLALVESLNRRSDVEYAEPNYLLYPLSLEPSDEYYDLQWHYASMSLPEAWGISTGSSDTVVAVLDTGILYEAGNPAISHPDFDPLRTLPGYDFVSVAASANDGDGRDANPYDTGDEMSTGYHGTHVAGTVGAWTNNARGDGSYVGVSGVNWSSKLLPVRVLGVSNGTLADVVDGALWAAGIGVPSNPNPADVLNLSLGGAYSCTNTEQAAFDQIIASGTVVVVAAGNSNVDAYGFSPASCSGVITVGATNILDGRSYYSNYGDRIDVMAPGGDNRYDLNLDTHPDGVYSPLKDDATAAFGYEFYQGTSMAAPHVAGLVALMMDLDPSLAPSDVLAILQGTAWQLSDIDCRGEGASDGSWLTSSDCGAGLVNAYGALSAVSSGQWDDFSLSISPTTVSVEPGESRSITVSITRDDGFTGEVQLTLEDAPSGVSGSFSPNPSSESSSTLTLDVGGSVSPGSYTLTIRGTSGGMSRTVSLGLTVLSNLEFSDTLVAACYQDDCRDTRSTEVTVRVSSGSSSTYSIADLAGGNYGIFAWQDTDGDTFLSDGDYVGGYPFFVAPPASNINFTMEPYASGQAPGLTRHQLEALESLVRER